MTQTERQRWRGEDFWQDVRDDYREGWRQIREDWTAEIREVWAALRKCVGDAIRETGEDRARERRLVRESTGKERVTRRDIRNWRRTV
jgi:hypothetical protein